MRRGKTYTLADPEGLSHEYYATIRRLADRLCQGGMDERSLLEKVRRESDRGGGFARRLFGDSGGRLAASLWEDLAPYLEDVAGHLRGRGLAARLDATLSTRPSQYHLYMLEIELANRVNGEAFRRAPHRMALIAHCLRDTRDDCRMQSGDFEAVCSRCDRECYVNLGSTVLERYGIHPYISVSMDHERLFKGLLARHPRLGALGIACVPELVSGIRLCHELGIPAVGVPLDANRCSRWFDACLESSFSVEELERLVGGVSRTD